jgi:hypothetical protein
VAWRSPSYRSAQAGGSPDDGGEVSLEVSLEGLSTTGLHTIQPANYNPPMYGNNPPLVVDCTATFPLNATSNSSMAMQCAWAALKLQAGWLNATVTVKEGGQAMVLTASTRGVEGSTVVEASAYGWGPIPMMSAYDLGTGLPVLPWNQAVRL